MSDLTSEVGISLKRVHNIFFKTHLTLRIERMLGAFCSYLSELGEGLPLSTVSRSVHIGGNVFMAAHDENPKNAIALQDLRENISQGLVDCEYDEPLSFDLNFAMYCFLAGEISESNYLPKWLLPRVEEEIRTGIILFDLDESTMDNSENDYGPDGDRVSDTYRVAWSVAETTFKKQVVLIGVGSSTDAEVRELVLKRMGVSTLSEDCFVHCVPAGEEQALCEVIKRYIN